MEKVERLTQNEMTTEKCSVLCFLWYTGHAKKIVETVKSSDWGSWCLSVSRVFSPLITQLTLHFKGPKLFLFLQEQLGVPLPKVTPPSTLSPSVSGNGNAVYLLVLDSYLCTQQHDHEHLFAETNKFPSVSSGIRISGRWQVRLSHSHPTGPTCTQTHQLQEAIG